MDSKVLLGKILHRINDKKTSQVDGYNSFGYLKETNQDVFLTRENGDDTRIPFEKILKAIEAYKNNIELYDL
tara:strand:- start:1117 stop:1332 length:216 start_codon:yes stop_codon:yes gene_type:complete